ncbi:hypothetical protein EJ419_03745 [Alloscardovia theropitheci]|uniref:Glycosyltransferase RgtA/B/C/D-like domain-containing protein n=1 Tax=Alloscardovia theropitheci TaxID=2496842 RepID=A0A4V2MTX3_9BIFI|nr:hypothetical protein EJ419_03745 [Alloscardovia theropitheci]
MSAWATSAAYTTAVRPFSAFALALCAIFFFFYIGLFYGAEALIHRFSSISLDDTFSTPVVKKLNQFYTFTLNTRSIIVSSATISIFWIPWFILLAPGVMSWDTGDQVAQWFGISAFGMQPGQINAHHPVMSTVIFGSVLKISKSLLGTYIPGLFVYTLAKLLVFSTIFGFALNYAHSRWNISRRFSLLGLAFFALLPVIPVYLCIMVKDVLHLLFLAPWIIMFFEGLRTHWESLKSVGFTIAFLGLSVMSCLTRQTGAVIVIACLFFAIFTRYATVIARLLLGILAILTCAISMWIFPHYAYPALQVVPTDSQQIFVVPLQITARAAKDHRAEISDADKNVISKLNIYSFDQMADQYTPYSADAVAMGRFNDRSQLKNYIPLWIRQGLRYPGSYLNAFMSVNSSWFAFTRASDVKATDVPHTMESNYIADTYIRTNTNPDTFGQIAEQTNSSRNDLADKLYNSIRMIPGINIFFYESLYTWIIPMFVLFTLARQRKTRKSLLYLAPYVLFLLSLLAMANSVFARFMLAAVLLTPIMLMLPYRSADE